MASEKNSAKSSVHEFTQPDDLDERQNPFVNPKVADRYRALYESTKYECRKRFDPEFTWTKAEDRRITWSLDWRVTCLACFMFASLNTDRGAIAQAVADNMLDDLGMDTNQYNLGNTLFYLSFFCAELPSQLISKRLGCDIWMPIEMCLWSLVSISQCRLRSAAGFYVCRVLMGLFSGGFVPDLVLWLSYFYTSEQLTMRLSFFWTSLSLTSILTSILAFGLFHLRGVGGLAGWSWLFLLEGIVTFGVGISAFFLMVPSVVQTKKRWNKRGWFTEHEEKIVVNRILRDDPTKGDMHNRQGLTPRMLWQGLRDWHLWPIYLVGLVAYITTNTITSYLTLLLRQMGYSTFMANIMAIPSIVIHIFFLLTMTWISEHVHSIFAVCFLQPFWSVPLLAVLRFWHGTFVDRWPSYAIITLLNGTPYIHAMMVSACSRNAQSIRNRTVSASVYNMFVQIGLIISANVYRTNDRPLYHTGNTVLFCMDLAMFPILLGAKLFYVTLNRRREKVWNALTPEQQEHYVLTTADEGSNRLNFRFSH